MKTTAGRIVDPALERLWRRYRTDGDLDAREKLILHYSPLVKYVAGRVGSGMPSHVDRLDLVSYGIFGLMDAIAKFDIDRGLKFETYAITRIRGAILDELRASDWVPRSVRAKERRIGQALARLQQQLQRSPTDDELADELGVDLPTLGSMLESMSMTSVAALDATFAASDDGESVALGETLSDRSALSPEEHLDDLAMRELLRDAIPLLSEREQKVLGLYYFESMTLSQIGSILGVTESRVSQIHSKAVLQLRNHLHTAVAA